MRVSHGGLLASAQKLMVPDENRRTVSGAHTTKVQYPALLEKSTTAYFLLRETSPWGAARSSDPHWL
jgi:hypothetical protein